jgi:Tol biopolymer transport system component
MLDLGTRLGALEITALLGKGGMGEVYRARDAKLKRDVAVKILPDEFSRDPDRLSRFQREAEVLASLNHPNIAAIYDIQEANDFRFLILELIEGETLADRIARGPIPLEEALDIARYICAALEAAHEKGIIHRDLKPANVKIAPGGTVKVLDFGLAKMAESQAEGRLSDSPTLTVGATQAGVILGTAAYMAPEQARGKVVDKRADIWAFGVVLFEMVTGRRLFEGEDASETLAAVIKEEPPWKLAPLKVRRLLQSCLEKNPTRRLRDIGDAWRLLDDTPQTMHAPARSWLAWSAATLFAILAALAFWAPWRTSPPMPELKRFQILLPENTSVGRFAVSPDGRWIAFAGRGTDGVSRVWVRAIDSLEMHPLRGTEGVDPVPPFWSPDSRFIAFAAARRLKKIDISGGPPQSIADLPGAQALGGSWNQDGVIIFGNNGPLMRVLASGGVPSAITALDDSQKESRHLTPVFLPDGRHFLYLRISNTLENSGIYIGSLDSTPAQENSKLIIATVFAPAYVPSKDPRRGHLLFLRDQVLMSQAFDVTRLQLTGEPVSLAEPVMTYFNAGLFSASLNGVLVYRTGTLDPQSTQLTWFDGEGKPLGTAWEPALYGNYALAPDDTRAAVSRLDLQGGGDIWIVDFLRNASSRFTFASGSPSTSSVWSPDGSRIIFRSNREGVFNLYWKPVSGVENEEILLKSGQGKVPTSWSHDGRYLLYHTTSDPKRKNDLWVLPLEGDRKPAPLVATEFDESDGRFSPDDHFVAYVSNESDRPEIYVLELAGMSPGRKRLLSKSGGTSPRWRGDGRALFYLAADGTVMQVDINVSAGFQSGAPQSLFKLPSGALTFDVTGDGKRFLAAVPVEQDAKTPLTVELNWEAGLKK